MQGSAPSSALARRAVSPQNVEPEKLGRVELQAVSSQHAGSAGLKPRPAAGLQCSVRVTSSDTAVSPHQWSAMSCRTCTGTPRGCAN